MSLYNFIVPRNGKKNKKSVKDDILFFFDLNFYKSYYEDLSFGTDVEYIDHYLNHGYAENRSPNILLNNDEFLQHRNTLKDWLENPEFEKIKSGLFSLYFERFKSKSLSEENSKEAFIELLNLFRKWEIDDMVKAKMFLAVYLPLGSVGLAEKGQLPAYFDWSLVGVEVSDIERFSLWYDAFIQNGESGLTIFDADFYRSEYPDLSGLDNVLYHYLDYGDSEGRLPSPLFDSYLYSRHEEDKGLLKLFSKSKVHSPVYLQAVEKYLSRYYGYSNRDTVITATTRIAKAYSGRFKKDGQFSIFMHMFNVDFIRCLDKTFSRDALETLIEWIERGGETKFSPFFSVNEKKTHYLEAYLDWYEKDLPKRILKTPFFDEEFYLNKHLDLKDLDTWGFIHYLRHGQYENRQAIPLFDPAWIAHTYNTEGLSALDFYFKCEVEDRSIKPSPSMMPINSAIQITDERRIAAGVYDIANECKEAEIFDLSEKSELIRVIEQASKIDPQIKVFEPSRMYSLMPFSSDLYAAIRPLKKLIGTKDILIFRDGINFGGADVVLKYCYHALKKSGRSVCIVSTGNVDWNTVKKHNIDEADVVDLSSISEFKNPNLESHLIYDTVIGSGCSQVYNLNSGALWKAIEDFGKILTLKADIYGFMFCDDRDEYGNVSGYPERYLLSTIRYMKKLYLDSYSLKCELAERLCHSGAILSKLVVFNTPIEKAAKSTRDYINSINSDVNSVAWAGRFDEQKRPDILEKIALLLPDIQFYVWGRPILSNKDYKLDKVPNIHLMGLYDDISEITDKKCDLYLYTSDWDGVPTILLNVQLEGLPIIASNVGGVSEILPDIALVYKNDPQVFKEKIEKFIANKKEVSDIFDDYKSREFSNRTTMQFEELINQEVL